MSEEAYEDSASSDPSTDDEDDSQDDDEDSQDQDEDSEDEEEDSGEEEDLAVLVSSDDETAYSDGPDLFIDSQEAGNTAALLVRCSGYR